MPHESCARASGWRRIALALTAAVGVAGIVGSGGGAFLPDFGIIGPLDLSPAVTVEPSRPMVQVGATVTFTSSAIFATAPVSYQWRRNGIAIVGATGAAYTHTGINLGDDGAVFELTLSAANGAATAGALLRVSSAPGVAYRDSEFALNDWSVTSTVEPSSDAPTFQPSQAVTAGNPGAFRSIAYQMPKGPASARLFHTASNGVYDPAQQGGIYALDMGLDCNRVATTTISETLLTPAFEQGGRWFAPQTWDAGCAPVWQGRERTALLANDFVQVRGAACGPAQACPDFSAIALPLRFGFASIVNLSSDAAAGAITQGIDNWRVTVWRR
jgi:hypothetical protein